MSVEDRTRTTLSAAARTIHPDTEAMLAGVETTIHRQDIRRRAVLGAGAVVVLVGVVFGSSVLGIWPNDQDTAPAGVAPVTDAPKDIESSQLPGAVPMLRSLPTASDLGENWYQLDDDALGDEDQVLERRDPHCIDDAPQIQYGRAFCRVFYHYENEPEPNDLLRHNTNVPAIGVSLITGEPASMRALYEWLTAEMALSQAGVDLPQFGDGAAGYEHGGWQAKTQSHFYQRGSVFLDGTLLMYVEETNEYVQDRLIEDALSLSHDQVNQLVTATMQRANTAAVTEE